MTGPGDPAAYGDGRHLTAARAIFKFLYPNGFGPNRQTWDDLAAEAARPVSTKAAHIESAGPRRARKMLDGYLAEAKAVVDALDAAK